MSSKFSGHIGARNLRQFASSPPFGASTPMPLSKGFVDRNVAEWRGNLDSFLPPTSSLLRGKTQPHHSAVSVEELANIAEFLTRMNTISAKCLLFGILTVLRQLEFRCARWDEIDFEAKTLTVPPERRKARGRVRPDKCQVTA